MQTERYIVEADADDKEKGKENTIEAENYKTDANEDEEKNENTIVAQNEQEKVDIVKNKNNIVPKRFQRIKYVVNGSESEGKVIGIGKQ